MNLNDFLLEMLWVKSTLYVGVFQGVWYKVNLNDFLLNKFWVSQHFMLACFNVYVHHSFPLSQWFPRPSTCPSHLSHPLSLFLSQEHFISHSFSLFHCLSPLSLWLFISVSLYLCVSLCVNMYLKKKISFLYTDSILLYTNMFVPFIWVIYMYL